MNISELFNHKKPLFSLEIFPPKKDTPYNVIYNTLLKLRGIPADSRVARGGFLKAEQVTRQKLEVIAKLNDLAAARGQSLSQLALTWILRDRRVCSLLIGASKPEQIEDCCRVVGADLLSAEELRNIEAILAPVSPPAAATKPAGKPPVKRVLKPIVKKA
jgi:aryl-alcohol dehydrogenase-like predicted oxidoreductase